MSEVHLPPVFRDPVVEISCQSSPYHLADLDMPRWWEITKAGKGLKPGVADTGIDFEHPEFEHLKISGAGFVRRRKSHDFYDGNGHGTHVASTICGRGVGFAPNVEEICIAKVLGDNGAGSNQGVAEGIHYLRDQGCNLINLSLGGPYDDPTTRDAILHCIEAGIIVVAATGNERASRVGYPAAHCIGVGAVDQEMKLAWFSNRGKKVDVVCYGVDIYAAIPRGNYQKMSGTSMATPALAGLILNMQSLELAQFGEVRTKSHEDILKLEPYTIDLGEQGIDTSYGRGFPDVQKAFESVTKAPGEGELPLDDSIRIKLQAADGTHYQPVTTRPI